jgi:hypothetical protein
VFYSVDGGAWTSMPMAVNPDWGSNGGKWYNANLGKFPEGSALRYYPSKPRTAMKSSADNGGLVFPLSILGAGLAITNPPANVTVATPTDTITLQGTANAVTQGNLRWTNALTGASGQIPAATPWSILGHRPGRGRQRHHGLRCNRKQRARQPGRQ